MRKAGISGKPRLVFAGRPRWGDGDMKGFEKRPNRRLVVQPIMPGRARSTVARGRKNVVYAFISLAMSAPAVHAEDIFDQAWQCASTVVEGVADLHGDGARALRFMTVEGGAVCVTRLGTPMTAAPIGLVLTLANGGILQKNCSATLYNTAAKPIAFGISGLLDGLGVLPDDARKFLADIVAGTAAGEALKLVPGIEVVSGSLTCGCDLYDAGLSIETIERVLNTADRIGNACGGEGWAATKEVAGAVVEVAGDAVSAGVLAASNVGDWVAGQTMHMSLQDYFDQNWVNGGKVELWASNEFAAPGRWHQGNSWEGQWETCKIYFDKHTMSVKNAQHACDDMRSGTTKENGLFADNGFQQRMFKRIFQFDVTGEVAKARAAAHTQLADLKPEVNVSQATLDEINASPGSQDRVSARLQAELPNYIATSIGEVYGTPQKEKEHNGEHVYPQTPPTWWPANTVGARA